MLEQYLIHYCAPTLAALKTASLFRFPAPCRLDEDLGRCRGFLTAKGVSVCVLARSEQSALIYVYRENQLRADLAKPGVARFLADSGYAFQTPQEAIDRLMGRLEEAPGFPHEIGLFLGYPLWDVYGFIRHKGQNCKACGHWKVYCREAEARRLFSRYHRCSHIYQRLWREGKSLAKLTVAA